MCAVRAQVDRFRDAELAEGLVVDEAGLRFSSWLGVAAIGGSVAVASW
jgi:hypothetical protein